MEKREGLFFFAISFLFLNVFLISAVPPVTTTQQFSAGYDISVPQDNILKAGEPYNFEFHVFNISNGAPIVEGIACYFHLYNSTGFHLVSMEDNLSSASFDYSFLINANNFTNPERYWYNIQCNSSSVFGGNDATILEITENGNNIDTGQSLIYIILLLINLIFLSIFIILSIKIPYENEESMTKEGPAITKVTKTKYLKLMCIWFSYGLFLWMITILAGAVNNYISFDPLRDMAMNLYYYSSIIGYIVSTFMVWFIFLNIWKDIVLNKKILKEGKALLNKL